jgi:hypothetical protein
MKRQFPFIRTDGNTHANRGERLNSNDPYEEVLTQAAVQARRYLRTIRERHAGVLPEAIKGLSALDGPLPARGENPLAILKLLDDAGSPATVASMGGRFFGGVIGGALPASVAAHWLADAWDQMPVYMIFPLLLHIWKTSFFPGSSTYSACRRTVAEHL